MAKDGIKPPKAIKLTHIARLKGKGTVFALNIPKGDDNDLCDWASSAVAVPALSGEDLLTYADTYGTSIHFDISAILKLEGLNTQKENLGSRRVALLNMLTEVENRITDIKLDSNEDDPDYLETLSTLQEQKGQLLEMADQVEAQLGNVEKAFGIKVDYDEDGREFYKIDGIGYVRKPLHMLIFQVCAYILYCGKYVTRIEETEGSYLFETSTEPPTLESIKGSDLVKSLFFPSADDGQSYNIWYEIILAANLFPMQDRGEEDDPKKSSTTQMNAQELITSLQHLENLKPNDSKNEEKPKA